jgi:hypothetical protein
MALGAVAAAVVVDVAAAAAGTWSKCRGHIHTHQLRKLPEENDSNHFLRSFHSFY